MKAHPLSGLPKGKPGTLRTPSPEITGDSAAFRLSPFPEEAEGWAALLVDCWHALSSPSPEARDRLEHSALALGSPLALRLAEAFGEVYLSPPRDVLVHGRDDPSRLPVRSPHAFAVLGYALDGGRMPDELICRCDAAACAARAFPASFLLCSGGATGEDNPEGHTEAALMKAYLSEVRGISPGRILTDAQARDTVENVRNTLDILKEHGITSLTPVTSLYHRRRAHALFAAAAARLEMERGWHTELAGDYVCETACDEKTLLHEPMICLYQWGQILGLPPAQMARVMSLFSWRP